MTAWTAQQKNEGSYHTLTGTVCIEEKRESDTTGNDVACSLASAEACFAAGAPARGLLSSPLASFIMRPRPLLFFFPLLPLFVPSSFVILLQIVFNLSHKPDVLLPFHSKEDTAVVTMRHLLIVIQELLASSMKPRRGKAFCFCGTSV